MTPERHHLRDATPADFPAILALNQTSVAVLSPLDATRLAALHREAASHRVAVADGQVIAFLLAFREGTSYDSVNYRWFAARYPRFLYVDRVVVDAAARGQGLADRLYDDLLALARAQGLERVTCEIDVAPPNPASSRFHARRGFREVGRQAVQDGKKEVSLQVLTLCAAPAE
jgi:predicted GNAT superfamily acetyltransferase